MDIPLLIEKKKIFSYTYDVAFQKINCRIFQIDTT